LKVFLNPKAGLVAAGVSCALAYLFFGNSGLAGMALGLFGSAFGLFGWWLTIRLLEKESHTGKRGSMGGPFWVLFGFFIKMPLFFATAFLARRIGAHAVPCFLGGLGLVYFSLVGWSIARNAETT
jgi:hypothetical protein